MEFKLSEEEKTVQKSVREFCEKYIGPRWVEMDEKGEIPIDIIKGLASQGLLGSMLSPEFDGAGSSAIETGLAVEEVAYHDPTLGVAVYLLINGAWPYMLQLYGQDDAKQEILPAVTRGEFCFGIWSTEPQGGSDVAGVKTSATRKTKDTWVINGEKVMVSMIKIMERMPKGGGAFLITRSGRSEDRHKALTDFLLKAFHNGQKTPGFAYSLFDEIGRHSIKSGSVRFNNVEISDKYRIGDENKGFKIAMEGFNFARSMIGIATVGAARWALDQGIAWMKERRIRGKPLSSFQGIHFKLADLYSEIEAARLLCYRAIEFADRYYIKKDPTVNASDVATASACAKMVAPETALRVCEEVMKWHGGAAYFKDVPLHRVWQGAFSYVVGAEGSQNVMRHIIARSILGAEYVGSE